MAQLQVVQEKEHCKRFTDLCTQKYDEEGSVRCMNIVKTFTEMGGESWSVQLFPGSLRTINFACTAVDSQGFIQCSGKLHPKH